MSQKALVLMSGGLDSSVVLFQCLEKYSKDYISVLRLGSASSQNDLEHSALLELLDYVNFDVEENFKNVHVDFPWVSDKDHPLFDGNFSYYQGEASKQNIDAESFRSFVVPMRNLVYLSYAVSYAVTVGASELWIGFDYRGSDRGVDSPSWDKRPEFVESFMKTVSECNEWSPVKIVTPLQGMYKHDIIKKSVELGVPLEMTRSCYNDLPFSCGVCSACLTRLQGFDATGIFEDPLPYMPKDFIDEYLESLNEKEDKEYTTEGGNVLWKKDLKFDSSKCGDCGACCRNLGKEALVEVTVEDVERLAKHFNKSVDTVMQEYITINNTDEEAPNLLKTKDDNCIFLKGNTCSIHGHHPVQCSSFPLWSELLANEFEWRQMSRSCPGLNEGIPYADKEIDENILEE